VLRLGRVVSRLFGQVSFAELPADRIASRGYRLGRDLHAVSSHVGDEADGLAADVDAFIKALRDLHGSVGGKAQPRGSSLLQGRSGEGRAGVAPGGLCLDGADAEGRALQHRLDVGGLRLVPDIELLQAFSLEAG